MIAGEPISVAVADGGNGSWYYAPRLQVKPDGSGWQWSSGDSLPQSWTDGNPAQTALLVANGQIST